MENPIVDFVLGLYSETTEGLSPLRRATTARNMCAEALGELQNQVDHLSSKVDLHQDHTASIPARGQNETDSPKSGSMTTDTTSLDEDECKVKDGDQLKWDENDYNSLNDQFVLKVPKETYVSLRETMHIDRNLCELVDGFSQEKLNAVNVKGLRSRCNGISVIGANDPLNYRPDGAHCVWLYQARD
jgi:hypothetical protein